MIQNIISPDLKKSLEFINKYHKLKPNKTILIIIGDCIVEYHGRAKSFLDWGQRIIIVKQDNTILIHKPEMREPVNWQPSGNTINCSINKKNLILKSYNAKTKERMKISFREIEIIISSNLKDKAKLIISGMEKDFVNQIINDPSLIEEGFHISKKEKHVKFGLIDLYGFDKNHTPVIIEVKRSQANISSVHQLRMYVNEIKKDINSVKVRGILCAPKIPDMVKKLLSEYDLEWREVERNVFLYDDNQKTLKEFFNII
jgi:RecB family endonuclease NucS